MGGAHAELLRDTLRANGREVRLWSRTYDLNSITDDTIVVVRRDPLAAVLELYSQEGHSGKSLSPAVVGARVKQYCEEAVRQISRIRSGVSTRTLYTEDHTKPRHWAASMGVKISIDRDMRVDPIANEHELRTLCERDLATTIAEYKSTI